MTNAANDTGLAILHALIKGACTRIVVADASSNMQKLVAPLSSDTVQLRVVRHNPGDDDGWDRVVQEAAGHFGEIDYCINCSPVTSKFATPKPTLDLDPAEFKAGLYDTSRELWLACRAQLRQLTTQTNSKSTRSIVNIIPYGNFGTHPGHTMLAASSYGRTGMTKSMAKDFVTSGIRINAVCPGLVEGEVDTAPVLEQHMKLSAGRLITPTEVANAAVFLVGEGGNGMTGMAMPVDGGWSMTHN